jgi:squalene synthase HpnC
VSVTQQAARAFDDVVDEAAVMSQARAENFPVAMKLLPAGTRDDLLAIYGYARLVDDLGDEVAGDRLAALDWAEERLDAALAGQADHSVFVALERTIARHGLARKPFADLIEANRLDQVKVRYETWDELRHYCTLSADPVGRLVLAVFGVDDLRRRTWSDMICTGLQLVEHLQDVGEDYGAGRIYLPAVDMHRFGCVESDLAADTAGVALRRVVAYETFRARELLRRGTRLVASLRRKRRLAIAGFVAGGHAALDAIEAADHDVLGADVTPRPHRLGVRLVESLVKAPMGTADR